MSSGQSFGWISRSPPAVFASQRFLSPVSVAMSTPAGGSGLRAEDRPRPRRLYHCRRFEPQEMTMNQPAQPVQHRDLSRPRQKASLELLLAEHPRCFGICPRSVSANPAFPYSTCRGSGSDLRLWRTANRRRYELDQIKIDFGRIDRSSPHRWAVCRRRRHLCQYAWPNLLNASNRGARRRERR